MRSVFINHTNHPSVTWTEAELAAAEQFGPVQDFVFPAIDPEWDEETVMQLAQKNGAKILSMHPAAVLCQGEFTYCFALITFLKKQGITVLSACSNREVVEWAEGDKSIKTSDFVFVRFRRY